MKRILLALLTLVFVVSVIGCGNKSSDSGETKSVTLTFDYEKQSGLNYNDDAKVYVDDTEIGIVTYGTVGNVFVEDLTEGKHTLRLVSDTTLRTNKSNKVKIEVGDSTDFKLIISQSSMWGLRLSLDE
ncbi:MAG: hypothetical protein K6F66_03135 [Pseudobutyrivibrio sp.]|nr:hypothetical protein [Pseudobutyrivibrio sp.]